MIDWSNPKSVAKKISSNYTTGAVCLQEAANQAIQAAARIEPAEFVPFLDPRVSARLRETIIEHPWFDAASWPPPSDDEAPSISDAYPEYVDFAERIELAGCFQLTRYYGLAPAPDGK